MARNSIPGDILHGAEKVVSNPVKDVVNAAVPGASEAETVFGALTQKNTYIRVGEFLVGAMMIYVGLKGLFPTTVNVVAGLPGKAANAAAKGALVA